MVERSRTLADKQKLTNEELDAVLQFSQGLYNGLGGYSFFATPLPQETKIKMHESIKKH